MMGMLLLAGSIIQTRMVVEKSQCQPNVLMTDPLQRGSGGILHKSAY